MSEQHEGDHYVHAGASQPFPSSFQNALISLHLLIVHAMSSWLGTAYSDTYAPLMNPCKTCDCNCAGMNEALLLVTVHAMSSCLLLSLQPTLAAWKFCPPTLKPWHGACPNPYAGEAGCPPPTSCFHQTGCLVAFLNEGCMLLVCCAALQEA